jgi:asparagine N-glycosylation enzyme membrane subunit Stt3
MTHPEFVEAYRTGSIRVHIDRAAAARYVSARLLLPLVMLPVLGIGVALALTGWIWTGLAVIGGGTLAPILIKQAAPHFLITQALQDRAFYDDVAASGLLQIVDSGGM